MAGFHSFLWLSDTSVCVCTLHLLSLSVDGYFDCFHILAVSSNAAVNFGMHVSFWSILFLSSFKCPEVEFLDPMGAPFFFFFLRNLHSVFGSGCTNLHCYQQYMRIFFSSNPYQHLIFLIFVMIVTLTSVRWYLIMVLICISPMTRDVEVFSRAYYLSVCLWKNACLGPLLIFWIGLFVLSDI